MSANEHTSPTNRDPKSSAELTGIPDSFQRHNVAQRSTSQIGASWSLGDNRRLYATSANQTDKNTNQVDAYTTQNDANARGTHSSQPVAHYVFDCDTSDTVTIITGTGTASDPKIAYTIAAHLLEARTPYFRYHFKQSPKQRVFEMPNLATTPFAHYLGFVTGSLRDFSAHAREQAQARAALSGVSVPVSPFQLDVFTLQAHMTTWFFGESTIDCHTYCNAIMDAIFRINNLGPVVVQCIDEWHRLAMTSEEMREYLWKDTRLTSLMVECILGSLSEEEIHRKIGEKVWWEAAFLRKLILRRMDLVYEGKEAKVPRWNDRKTYYQRYPTPHIASGRNNADLGWSQWRG